MRTLVSLFALAVSTPAFALSCMWGVTDLNVTPTDAVPLNARFMVEHVMGDADTVEVHLFDASGTEVACTQVPGYAHVYVVPDAPLAPNSVYTLQSGAESDGFLDVTFTTADAEDLDAPDAPALLSAQREFDGTEWGDVQGVRVTLDEVFDAAHYEYEISLNADFSDAHRVASRNPELLLGSRLCDAPFPEYDRSERYHVRARAVDLAGNASEWSETPGAVKGCSTLGSPALALGIPFGLLALFGRRR